MNQVMRDSGVTRLFYKNRLEYFAALALMTESLVGLGSGEVQSDCVQDGRFTIIRISHLQDAHLLLVSLRVSVFVLSVLLIDLTQGIDVTLFAGRGLGSRVCDIVCSAPCLPSSRHVPVVPKPVIMRHSHAPLRHRARRILHSDCVEGLTRILVLKRVQTGHPARATD